MSMKNPTKTSLIIILILTSVSQLFGQYELEKRKYQEYINMDYLYRIDKDRCLYKVLMHPDDSIRCVSFKNYKWFCFAERQVDGDLIGKFAAINEKNNKINIIKDVSMYVVSSTIDYFDIFKDNLFLKEYYGGDYDEGIHGQIKISLIDTDSIKITKEIFLEKEASFKRMYERNDTLFIEVQPVIARPTPFYYFLLLLRCPPGKYYYVDIGNTIRYSFDKSFNFIKKETVFEEEKK